MAKSCRILSPTDKEIAKKLGMSESVYTIVLSTYASSVNNPDVQPTEEEISKFHQSQAAIAKAEKALIGQNTEINIFAGANENADLSNFAERPFTYSIPGYEYFKETGKDTTFKTVEHAFQAAKWDSQLSTNNPNNEKILQRIQEILNAPNAAKASEIGKRRDANLPFDKNKWDKESSNKMKEMLKASFEQNPKAKERLLSTGNAQLTHTQATSKWKTEFPRLLMEVRNEFRGGNTSDRLTQDQVLTRLNEWQVWTKEHIKFNEEDHTYSIDGVKVDYSVTQFEGTEFEAKHINGDYSFTQEIGKAVDALTRDFFKSDVDITKKNYPNLNEKRKQEIVDSLIRLKVYFDQRFGEGYTVVTDEFPLAGIVKSGKAGGEVTMAGTMDLIVIDKDGFVHIFDMKAKNRTTFEYKNKSFKSTDERDYTFQLNTYQQLLEGIIPGLKVASKQLIWFNQEYPKQFVEGKGGDAKYVTDEKTGEVTVTDLKTKQTQPLADYSEWKTPQLKTKGDTLDDESAEASIKKIKDSKSSISEVIPIDPKWSPTQNFNNRTQMEITNKKPDFSSLEQQEKGEVTITAKGETPVIPDTEMQVDTDNPRARYLQALSSNQRTFRGEWVGREFSNVVSNLLEDEIQDTLDEIAMLNSGEEDEQRYQKVSSILNSSMSLQEKLTKLRELGLGGIQQAQDVLEVWEGSGVAERSRRLDDAERKLNILNDPDRGRKYIIETKTPSFIFDKVKERIEKQRARITAKGNLSEKQKYISEQLGLTIEYWDFIVNESLATIEGAESVRLVAFNTTKMDNDTTTDGEAKSTDDDNDLEEEDTNDDETGQRNANGNEGWGFKLRTVDPVTTLSKAVKAILSGLLMRGDDGRVSIDDIGNNRYLNQEYAHAVLISELSIYKSPEKFCKEVKEEDYDATFGEDFEEAYDFSSEDADGNVRYWQLTALREVAKKYAWVEDVITRIVNEGEEDGNKSMKLVSMFYSDFRKDFIPYWKQFKDKDGKWKTIRLNQQTATQSALNQALTNYEQGRKVDGDSVYGNIGNEGLSKENAEKGVLSEDIIKVFKNLKDRIKVDDEDFNTATEALAKALRMIGFEVTNHTIANALTIEDGTTKMLDCCNYVNTILRGIISDNKPSHLVSTYKSQYNSISENIGLVTELENMQSFRSGDKTFYSYSAPNHLDALFDNLFKNPSNDAEKAAKDEFMQREFGKYKWFKKGDKWRSLWLEEIAAGNYLDKAELKELNTIASRDKKGKPVPTYYTDWTPLDIKAAFIREFFSVPTEGNNKPMAWYNFPIFANSPVAKFVKFRRYDIHNDDDMRTLMRGFRQVVMQEIDRITLVNNRAEAKCREIGNFDKAGKKFCFFPALNRVEGFYDNCINLRDNESALNDYIDTTMAKILEDGFNSFLTKNLDDTKELEDYLRDANILSKNSTETEFNEALRDYYLNQAFASTQIIQLCTVDIAYYKNGTDFQKRFKELYAAGTKLNTNSKYGKQFESTVYLKDSIITSFSYSDIKDALNDAENDGRISKYDKAIILAKFKDVNIADAQAYRSLKSMRSVLDMLGKWTDAMEAAMKRFENGEWRMADFELVWQTIKPFVYTQIEKPDGLGGSIKVPHQNKNSEFLILAMYNIIRSPINKSPMMRGLDKFMQENDIDVIQFESAVKAGNQGKVDLTHSKVKLEKWFEKYSNIEIYVSSNETKSYAQAVMDAANSDKQDYATFKKGLDALLDKNIIDQDDYNEFINDVQLDEKEAINVLNEMTIESEVDGKPVFKKEVVHEIPYKDYCIQQPTPEHLVDHEAVFGSQFRNLIISDLPENFKVTIKGKEYDRDGIKHLYQSLIVSNLIKDFQEVKGKFATIEDLQKALLQTVKGNPRYSRDMVEALQIVTVNVDGREEKVFNIPLDNPSTTDKIQELTNSMFKSAIQKQKIKGGACIMVSSFGLMDDLHIRFNKEGDKSSGIKGIECYLPASSRKFYEPFMKTGKNGEKYLDVEELKKAGLDKLIGYRIPTEDKYSMANLIVKGFLPQQNGSAIMLPADITTIAGSDFDVDKMFLMIPEFTQRNIYDIKQAWQDFYGDNPDIAEDIETKKMIIAQAYLDLLIEQDENWKYSDIEDRNVRDMLINRAIKDGIVEKDGKAVTKLRDYNFNDEAQKKFSEWFKTRKNKYFLRVKTEKIEYDLNKGPLEQSRQQRNNMLIDISYAILSHPDTATKVLNPGSFDKMKIAARIATIANDEYLAKKFWVSQKFKGNELVPTNAENDYDADELADMLLEISKKQDLDTLDDFLKKEKLELDPLSVDTFIYYHIQNMTGDALIGMYALNTTMQAKYQNTKLELKDEHKFKVNGRWIKSLHNTFTEPSKRGQGERISKICANGSAASVDNVKDPVLADLMQNTKTANICGFMMRAGMTLEEIGLFFSQPLVRKAVQSSGSLADLEKYLAPLIKTLGDLKGNYRKEDFLSRDFSSKELLMNILPQPAVEWGLEKLKKGTLVGDNLIEVETDEVDANGVKKVDQIRFDPTKLRKALAQQIEAIEYMIHIRDCAEDLSMATRISRADSPNGAINRNIAGARNQIQAVANYKAESVEPTFHLTNTEGVPTNDYLDASKMSEQEMLDAFMRAPMPMLQAFYSLGIDFGLKAMKEYYVYNTDIVENYTKYLYNNTKRGTLTDEQVRTFYQELVEFALTKSSLIGDDFDEKRDYYLYDYPDEFMKVMQKYPEIANLKALKKLVVQDNDINFENAGKTTPRIREALMRDFDSLLYMNVKDEKGNSTNVAQKLAEDLFMYAFFRNGFKFGPMNYGMYFSTAYISSFPSFVQTLRTMKHIVNEPGFMQNFMQQFYANHTSGYLPYFKADDPDLKDKLFVNKDENGNIIALAVKKGLVYNTKPETNPDNVSTSNTYPYIVCSGQLFVLTQASSPYAYYSAMPILTDEQKGKREVKYNANMSLKEMSLIQTDPERLKKDANNNSLAEELGLTMEDSMVVEEEADNEITIQDIKVEVQEDDNAEAVFTFSNTDNNKTTEENSNDDDDWFNSFAASNITIEKKKKLNQYSQDGEVKDEMCHN